ncbi:Pol-like protein, partial [Thalictrum thalictroides]
MELDIDGYRKILYAYIIPKLAHDLILGKPWMEREDVVYHAKQHSMEIREATIDGQPLQVREKSLHEDNDQAMNSEPNIKCLSAGVFLATVRRARKVNSEVSQIFTITLADIQKALAPEKKNIMNLDKLPFKYSKYSDLFNKELGDKLPPHRVGSDHEIKLEPNKEIPWGPLYG